MPKYSSTICRKDHPVLQTAGAPRREAWALERASLLLPRRVCLTSGRTTVSYDDQVPLVSLPVWRGFGLLLGLHIFIWISECIRFSFKSLLQFWPGSPRTYRSIPRQRTSSQSRTFWRVSSGVRVASPSRSDMSFSHVSFPAFGSLVSLSRFAPKCLITLMLFTLGSSSPASYSPCSDVGSPLFLWADLVPCNGGAPSSARGALFSGAL